MVKSGPVPDQKPLKDMELSKELFSLLFQGYKKQGQSCAEDSDRLKMEQTK